MSFSNFQRKAQSLQEIDVVLTDFLLLIESLYFTVLIFNQNNDPRKKRPYLMIFLGLALASFFGGIYHGYYHHSQNITAFFLWWVTQVCVGVSAYGFAVAGIDLIFQKKKALLFNKTLLFILAAYCVLTFWERAFWIVIIFYLPATILTLAGFYKTFRLFPNQKIAIGIFGLSLSLVAPVIQQLKITIHPAYLTHNASYHLVVMAALFMFFVGVKAVLNLPTVKEKL